MHNTAEIQTPVDFDIQTDRLKLGGLKISGSDQSAPLVIALHGWLDNAASFMPLMQRVAHRKKQPFSDFIAIDLPGHGMSEHRCEGDVYHLIENIIDIVQLAEQLKKQRKLILLGHSLGGIIAALSAAAAPEVIDGLILLDSLGPMVDKPGQVLPQLRKAVSKISHRNSDMRMKIYPTREDAASARMNGIGKVSRESAMLLVNRGMKEVEDGFVWRSDPRLMEPSMLRLSESQLKEIFEGIECHTLLIAGNQGYIKQYSGASERFSYIKNLDYQLVDGGHHFHMDGDVTGTSGKITAYCRAFSD